MDKTRNLSPWAYWMARLGATTQGAPPVATEAIEPWLARARQCLEELLGPAPERVPLAFEIIDDVACEGYHRQKVVFDVEQEMSVPAYLLVPEAREAPGPAVLAVHGHGPGKDQICGLVGDSAPNADYALQLVREGFVVLAPDLRCFGERLDELPCDHYACDTNLVHAVMAGVNPLAQNLWDLGRCLDVLSEHPLVDPGRLGVAGLSYGGTMSLFLAAHDARVKVAVVSGYLSSLAASHKVPLNMCGSQVLFGMLGRLEHADVASLVAPRPLLVETGLDDPIFPCGSAVRTVGEVRRVYEHFGAGANLKHDLFDGGHQWHGKLALPFFSRHL